MSYVLFQCSNHVLSIVTTAQVHCISHMLRIHYRVCFVLCAKIYGVYARSMCVYQTVTVAKLD